MNDRHHSQGSCFVRGWAGLVVAALALSLTGCGEEPDSEPNKPAPAERPVQPPRNAEADADDGGKAQPARPRTAAEEIAHWATIKQADGPGGRPLPLTASWVPGGMFGMRSLVEMIKEGHHVLPTISDPKFGATYVYILGDHEGPPTADSHHLGWLVKLKPEFEYLAEHKLPFALMGNNWASGPARLEYQYHRAKNENRKTFSPKQSTRLMIEKDGEITSGSWKLSSPFGPDERWAEFGRFWMDNGGLRWLRELYPDPPMVVFLNNNEAGEIGLKHCGWSVRFQREYGEQDLSKEAKQRIVHEAYDHKYEVLFDAARGALSEPAWRNNSVFVAYNAWPRSVKGRTEERNHPREWKRYDGAMPEFYLNDWQIYRGKTDYNYWSPQTEGLRIQSSQDVIFDLAPDYYFASIAWDGGQPARRRSAINCLATGMYGTGAQQRWDFARYEGMVQFGLWAMRPRVMREFRYPVSHHDVYDREAFMAVVRSVDRPWEHEVLGEFWRFGELVTSDAFEPPDAQVAKGLKFYSRVDALLPVDANPPRDGWPRIWHFKANKRDPVKLRVLALALKRGEAPDRRWLIYAHAPLGAVSGPTVTLPAYGPVKLPFVTRSGSFFLVREADGAVETLIPGDPAEIDVTADKRFVKPGESIGIEVRTASPTDQPFTSYKWSTAKTTGREVGDPARFSVELDEPGVHLVRVDAATAAGRTVSDDVAVFVGDEPDEAVVYDVELSDASAWEGVWKGIGADKSEPLTYRMVPNPGAAPDIVLHGGRFVEDAELDRPVLELAHDHEGLWGVRSKLTCNHAYPNLTISLRFKAETLDGTQVLYAQGGAGKGFNIYLHDGKLYAGSMSGKRDWGEMSNRAEGDNGHWLSTGKVAPDRWHHVALVLAGGTEKVEPDKLSLYLDGEKVATGPGARIPNHHAAPRIGTCLNTTLHTGQNVNGVGFRGRIADFRQVNAAVPPR